MQVPAQPRQRYLGASTTAPNAAHDQDKRMHVQTDHSKPDCIPGLCAKVRNKVYLPAQATPASHSPEFAHPSEILRPAD